MVGRMIPRDGLAVRRIPKGQGQFAVSMICEVTLVQKRGSVPSLPSCAMELKMER